MAIRTIFTMVEDCSANVRLGWYEFVRDYGGITRTLLVHYFPVLKPELDQHVVGVFERAHANDSAWCKGLHFQNEREFMMSFRELLFAYGRTAARLPVPELSLDQFREIVKDLNVVEREVMWLYVKGHGAPQIAPMMMNAEATAKAVKGIADQRLKDLFPAMSADAFIASARSLMEAAEQTKSDTCLPLKTYNNLVNGQLSWRERDLAEEHIRDCFYCLDRFTGYQEMIRLRKDAVALPETEIEIIIAKLGFEKSARKRGAFAKLFGK